VGAEEGLDLGAEGGVAGTGPVQERRALGGLRDVESLGEDRFFRQGRLGHG
jgi:hypothetical protein